MLRHLAVVAVGVSLLGIAAPSKAQVWVGGGGVRVRAPFVRVDVYPYGGVSVRAPFAAVDVPSRGYYYEPGYPPMIVERRVIESSFPTAAEIAAMNDEQLNGMLRAISQRLHERLNRFDTGDTWQRYLRLPEEAFDPSANPEARVAALAKLVNKFNMVAADPQYSMIARLPAFQAMQTALSVVVSRPQSSTIPTASTDEDLPLPAPEQPAPSSSADPFLQPKPRQ